MITTHCILCGDKEQVRQLYPETFQESDLNRQTYSARRLPDRVHYRIVKCDRCGLVFSNPIVPPDKIVHLYHQSVCTYDQQVEYITKTYLKLFNHIQDDIPQSPKVLEVGCGNGFFLQALQEQGIKNVWGVEPGTDMVNKAPSTIGRNIKADIFRKGQFPKESFDVVCCFHTLDHLTDPKLFAEESYRILKPDGYVLTVTHDSEGLSVKLFGERSPIYDIEHIYLFSKSTITQLFESFGFRTVGSSSLINTYPLSYWLRMSGLPKGLKNIGQNILSSTGLSKINFSLAGGNIVYIGKKL